MNVKSFIKRILTRACVYFSVIMLCYIIIAAIVDVSGNALLLEAGRTVLFFVFSLLLACANCLFGVKSISGGLRLLIHYVITLFAFYTCFMLSLSLRTSGMLIGLVAFTAVYFAIMGISAAFTSKYRSNSEKAEEYQKQYGKLKR